jgi:hypothetical protein
MPKIAEIEGTPNPNALKFVLKEPLTWGIKRSYDNAEEAKDDPLAAALFDIGHVTNVFYIDNWLTVTQDGGSDWKELTRKIAEPVRAAPAASTESATRVAAGAAAVADYSPEDQQRLDMINALLDPPVSAGRRRGSVRDRPGGQQARGALPGGLRQLPELDLGNAHRHREPAEVDRARHRSRRGLAPPTDADHRRLRFAGRMSA